MRAFHFLALILSAAATAPAQSCPFERTKSVPASFTAGPGVECDSGIQVVVAGVEFKSRQKECPLFVVITPTHDAPEPSTLRTLVVQSGLVPEHTAFFKCVPEYLLFFVINSTCEFAEIVVTGMLPRLRTEGCPESTGVEH